MKIYPLLPKSTGYNIYRWEKLLINPAVKLYKKFGEKGLLALAYASRQVVDDLPKPDFIRDSEGSNYGYVDYPTMNTQAWYAREYLLPQFYTHLQGALKMSFNELFEKYAHPCRQWERIGIQVMDKPDNMVPPVKGIKGKFVKELFEKYPVAIHNRDTATMMSINKLWLLMGPNMKSLCEVYDPSASTSYVIHSTGSFALPTCLDELPEYLARNWRTLKNCGYDNIISIIQGWCPSYKELSVKDLLEKITFIKYSQNIPNNWINHYIATDFPAERALEHYYYCKDILVRQDDTYETVPHINFEHNGYTFERVDKRDPLQFFLGHYTHCCQVISGAAHSCVLYGVQKSNSAFYVVRKQGEIIAQSWAWRSGNTLVFDNIEARGHIKRVMDIYKEAAKKLIGLLCLDRIHLGTGYMEDFDLYGLEETTSVRPIGPADGRTYTDAKVQVLLAKKGGA